MKSILKLTAGLTLCLTLAHVWSGCGDDPAAPANGYATASGTNGGRLYDKFWADETGYTLPADVVFDFNAKPEFFRCKQCHGWDRLGTQGAYANRGPTASRPNISSVDLRAFAASHSAQEIHDALARTTDRRGLEADLSTYNPTTNPTVGDQMPSLTEFLNDSQLWDLVRYLKDDAVDVSELYDFTVTGAYPTATIAYSNLGLGGDEARGNAIYANRCADCHGPDGTVFLVDGNAYTVGRHLRSKPYEDQHKLKFGQLGSVMDSVVTDLQSLKDLYTALSNTTLYPNARPTGR